MTYLDDYVKHQNRTRARECAEEVERAFNAIADAPPIYEIIVTTIGIAQLCTKPYEALRQCAIREIERDIALDEHMSMVGVVEGLRENDNAATRATAARLKRASELLKLLKPHDDTLPF